MIFNERILQVVLTLADELHFGRASARLHVSQPALSGTVKNLERDLGVCLFSRTSRHVELTDAGQVFVAEARRLMEEGERVITLVRGSSPDILGPLRVGYPASINLRWLCSLIAHARTGAFLAADLQFISTEAIDLHGDLTKRTLHAAFFAGQLCHPDLQSVTLFTEPFTAVLGSGHPMAQSTSLLFEQLEDEPVVWLVRDVNPPLYDSFMDSCTSRGYRPNIVQEVRTFSECLEFAREALGITFLPSFMQSSYMDESVVFVPLPEDSLHTEYKLAYRRNGASEDVARFVKFVQDHVRKTNAFRAVCHREH